ncbi:MAG: 5'/3'-nucleotidase SurE, partial [Bacteroidaceae bacterium]|nr:5'/3'-nucleotidase SurE [Bacteroidaceae bacterium]
MQEERPYILISNDDGYTAPGINYLIDTLMPIADIIVVAPDSPRSGAGCCITPNVP